MAASQAGGDEAFSPPQHRDRIFGVILLGTFFGQLGFSILTPFFPAEAKSKGVNQTTLGWIFSIFELATLIFTPVASRLLVKWGAKPALVLGNLLGGVANILSGFCWYASDGAFFISSNLALRATSGLAFSFQSTAGYSLLTPLFGPNLSTAAGILEGCNGLAAIMGPLAGSLLFTMGGGAPHLGYVLPFAVLGVTEVIVGMLNALMLPKLPTPPSSQPSLLNYSPKALLTVVNCTIMGISMGLLGPTLQPLCAAAPLNFSVPMVGVAMAVICGAYTLASVLVGKLDDLSEGKYALWLMAWGALLVATSFFLMGPLTLGGPGWTLEIHPSVNLFWTSTFFFGVGVAFGFIPVYKQLLAHAKHSSSEERDLAASSTFTISVAMGSFLGPTLGGLFAQLVGERRTFTYAGILELLLCCVLVVLASTALRPDVRAPLLAEA